VCSSDLKRKIKGKDYFYLIYREDGKFKAIYKGKFVSEKDIKRFQEVRDLRNKYRKLLSLSKKQIRYLKGALRGKEEI